MPVMSESLIAERVFLDALEAMMRAAEKWSEVAKVGVALLRKDGGQFSRQYFAEGIATRQPVDDARVVARHGDLITSLREPRAGIHDDGTEELKTWEALFDQCRAAADALDAACALNGRSPGYDMEPEIQAQAAEYRAMQREAPSSHPAGTQATPQGDQRGTTPSPAGTGDSAPKMECRCPWDQCLEGPKNNPGCRHPNGRGGTSLDNAPEEHKRPPRQVPCHACGGMGFKTHSAPGHISSGTCGACGGSGLERASNVPRPPNDRS